MNMPSDWAVRADVRQGIQLDVRQRRFCQRRRCYQGRSGIWRNHRG
jgi:hypothetical protein